LNPGNLQINPKIRILHRKGVLFAGQLSGLAQPVQLLEFDIVLLHCFLHPVDPQKAMQEVLAGNIRKILPAVPSPQTLMNRIQQLYQAQVLVEGSVLETQPPDIEQTSLTECSDETACDGNTRLRLGVNIAIFPNGSRFQVWSPSKREYYYPGIELLLLMVSFLGDTTAGEVIAAKPLLGDAEARAKGIEWLINAGFLIHSDSKPLMPRQLPEQNTTIKQPVTGDRWQDLKPDGRIPVYFTPHMENHYPLALGMISAAISAHDGGALLKRFQLLPISYLNPQELINGPYRKFGPGIWLFSNYMWSLDVNLQISNMLKSRDNQSLTIHGGPSTPGYPAACADFMNRNQSVDIAVHGEGEVAVSDLLERFIAMKVAGSRIHRKTWSPLKA
jgi:hypothetical protein